MSSLKSKAELSSGLPEDGFCLKRLRSETLMSGGSLVPQELSPKPGRQQPPFGAGCGVVWG